MSMYRQLWLAIILSMLLALAGSLLASLFSARAYLEQQLSMKNADNAAALALSLSQQQADPVAIELAVSALFDSGHYESILVRDPQGRALIERVAPPGDAGAPAWFIERLPIRAEAGEAQITNGWQQVGTIVLVSHSRFGYEALWTSTREMIAALTLASLVGGYLGSLILRRLRRPLQAVIRQASDLSNRRFVAIPEPSVPELKQLAAAMNSMVARLKTLFEEEAARLETVRREANYDRVTGLANRDYLIAELRTTLEDELAQGGSLMLIRIADLAGINRRLGREATDEMLGRVASRLDAAAKSHPDGLAARMNGADFALLLPGQRTARELAGAVLGDLVDAIEPYTEGGPSAFIGLGSFPRGTPLRVVLSQVDSALIAIEADGINGIRDAVIDHTDDLPGTNEEWTRKIREALEHKRLRLVSFPVVDMEGRLLHEECPLRLRLEEQGEWLPAGRFLPVAEKLDLVPELDVAAIGLGLAELEARPELRGLAINLSASTLAAESSIRAIESLLKKHRTAAGRLWIEVAEKGMLKHIEAFRRLCELLHGFRCVVGVEHFGREFSQIGQLHDLGLNYIKVDSGFIRRIADNPGNQAFLKGAATIAHGIGLQVIAEGVLDGSEFSALAAIGFDGATGPGVRVAGAAERP